MATAGGTAVRISDVVKHYRLGDGTKLVATNHVTADIPAGLTTALMGSSGSGKSTLLHLIGAITKPDFGSINIDGEDISRLNRKELADYRSTIGFVFQQFHLLPAFTALDNVLAPLVSRKVSFDKHKRALELLEAVGLGGRETALPSQLSGGQQQRVAIARALVNGPQLLLADEPTGNLDSVTAGGIMSLIHDLQRANNTTVIIATHDPDIASNCDRKLQLKDGRLIAIQPQPIDGS